jgi:integrase
VNEGIKEGTPMKKLTHQFVANITKPGRYFDAGSNLHLLVRSGPVGPNKYWIHRHTHKGRRLDRSLGVFPNVPLSEARKLAIDLRARINNGVHVADAPKNILHINQSFKDYSLEWIEINKGLWSNTKHYRQWISTLESYVYPRIGNKTLSNIGTDDVISVLKPIWSTKTESASRIRERVERILSAAIAEGLRDGPNPASWNGHLEFLLPSPSKIRVVKHYASIPYAEVPQFYKKLTINPALSALALRFLILTAARTGEALGCRWDEIEGNTWIVPPDRMKSRKAHRVPLSSAAANLLQEPKNSPPTGDLVFPYKGRPLSNMAMLQLLKRAEPGKTVHGFRSSFRIWAAEKSGYSSDVAELSLAHVSGSVIERTYMRSDLLDLRRELMEAWANYVTGEAHG